MRKNDLPEHLRAAVLKQHPELADELKTKKKGRYGDVAQKTELDGLQFDSKGESKRWADLQLRERAGEIRTLMRQEDFEFHLPAVGMLAYDSGRPVIYRADFTYEEYSNGKWVMVVEDYKGVRTKEYKIKKALMKFFHGITIRETGPS